jgi:hypothetical protein
MGTAFCDHSSNNRNITAFCPNGFPDVAAAGCRAGRWRVDFNLQNGMHAINRAVDIALVEGPR